MEEKRGIQTDSVLLRGRKLEDVGKETGTRIQISTVLSEGVLRYSRLSSGSNFVVPYEKLVEDQWPTTPSHCTRWSNCNWEASHDTPPVTLVAVRWYLFDPVTNCSVSTLVPDIDGAGLFYSYSPRAGRQDVETGHGRRALGETTVVETRWTGRFEVGDKRLPGDRSILGGRVPCHIGP